MRILVAGDNETEREGLAELISAYGYHVQTATTAKETIDTLKSQPDIDLILIDMVISEMDSLQLLHEIKSARPYIDVIIITDYTDLESAIKGIKEGATDFLMRPFTNNEIFLSIERIKEKRRREREEKEFQKRLEGALKEWRLTFDSMHEAVMLLDKEFNILRANRAFSGLVGVPVEALKGRKCYELVHNTKGPPSWCPVAEGVREGEELSARFYEPFLDRYLHISLTPVYEGNEITHYIHTIRDITKEKELERAVANTKETLLSAYEHSPYPIIIIKPDYRIKYLNPAFEGFSTLKKTDLLDRACYQALMCREEPCEDCPLRKVIKGKSVTTEERSVFCGDREVIFERTIYPLFNDKGEVEAVAEVINDVTDLRVAEKCLKESRDFLQSVLEGIGDAVIVIDRQLRILSANSGYLKQTGRELKDVLGSHCYELSHGYNMPCPEEGEDCPVIKTLNDGRHHSSLHVHRSSEGQRIYVEVNSYPLRDKAGNIYAAVETVTDVTEKVNLRRKLEESERKYRELYNNAPDLMHSLDEDGYIIECNDTEVNALGYSRQELLGRHIKDLLPEEYHREFDDKFRKLKEKGFAEAEWEIIKKDGERLTVLVKAVSIYDEYNRFVKTSSIMHDVTELRRLEREKEQLREQFIQAQKMEAIGTLSAGIAHDFNNMLMGILGFTEMAMDNSESETVRNYLQRVLDITERASELTHQILIIGRKAPKEKKLLNLNDFVNNFIKTIRRMVEENIDISAELSREELFIEADQGQLYQVLMNLVVNARDAIGERGGSIRIITEAVDECCLKGVYTVYPEGPGGKCVKITVSDNGSGIPEEIRGRIFEPFFTTKEVGKGTGLGLSVVYSVVEDHGGCIEVNSRVGEGTEFVLYFPASRPQTGTEGEAVSVMEDTAIDGRGIRVLAVDDEEIMRDFLHSSLTSMGLDVELAGNPGEALEKFRLRPESYRLAIIDRVMPGGSGIELLKELKKVSPGLKAIVSTGYVPSDDLEEIRNAPDVEILFKPFKLQELVNLIGKLVRSCPDEEQDSV